MLIKEAIGGFAIILSIYTYVPYFYGIYTQKTKPHAFSWIIWGLILSIACTAQVVKSAGPGAWVTGFEAMACLTVAVISLKYGERNITRSDWCFFLPTISAIPLWIMIGDPLWSVILLTVISVAGFGPTLRKSWHAPETEVAQTYLLTGPAYAMSLIAIENVTWTTALYPATLMVANAGFGFMILLRRKRRADRY
jgi:hypothetical protein